MQLHILRLEDRLLFDASAAAVLAVQADTQATQSESHTDGSDSTHVAQDQADSEAHSQETSEAQSIDGFAETVDSTNEPVRVLLVSSRIDGANQLAQAAADDVILVEYDWQSTSLSDLALKVREALNGQQADSIAFATHGQSGMFRITQGIWASETNLTDSAEQQAFWQSIGELMKDGGRIDLLACNVANLGESLLIQLDGFLDVNGKNVGIAASSDFTGNLDGYNWNLEYGNINALMYFNESQLSLWADSLATFTVINTDSTGVGSLDQAVIDLNASVDAANTIDFNIPIGDAVGGLFTILAPNKGATDGSYMLEKSVFIDGFSAGAVFGDVTPTHRVVIDGQNVQSGIAFHHTTNANLSFDIEGLTIHSFLVNNALRGVIVDTQAGSNDWVIQNNIFGTNPAQDTSLPNDNGIILQGPGTISIDSNIIVSSVASGVFVSGVGTSPSLSITSNLIGITDSDVQMGNTLGINILSVDGASISNNTISDNVTGIQIHSSDLTSIESNQIGTDIAGTAAIGNLTGISIINSTNTSIGSLGNGNIISGNTGDGIQVDNSDFTTISDNFIGLDVSGINALGNQGSGISLLNAPFTTLIGGTDTGNVISGNLGDGIDVNDAQRTTITGNIIGLDSTGVNAVANGNAGISADGAIELFIGGTAVGDRNIISGNTGSGVDVTAGGITVIVGNYIGLNLAGDTAVANEHGIHLTNTSGFFIGFDLSVNYVPNVISGNTLDGILLEDSGVEGGQEFISGNFIGTNATGTSAIANNIGIHLVNSASIIIGGTAFNNTANVISGNNFAGIFIENTPDQLSEGALSFNLIGTDVTGTLPINNLFGILIDDSSNHTIDNNLISGNFFDGIRITGNSENIDINNNKIGTTLNGFASLPNGKGIISLLTLGNHIIQDNVISGNLAEGIHIAADSSPSQILSNKIGTDTSGTIPIANFFGILINDSSGHQIDNNLISGNIFEGILIEGNSDNITINSNIIGANIFGFFALPNNVGIKILDGPENTVIGETGQNIISGNSQYGIFIDNASSTDIVNNFIGVDITGNTALPNEIHGIFIVDSPDNRIGKSDSGVSGNVISGNGNVDLINEDAGVLIQGLTSSNNLVVGNFIGTNFNGTSEIGNLFYGVHISNAPNNIIGTPLTGERNIISGNLIGVSVTNAGSVNNTIQNNFIGTDVTGIISLSNNVGIEIGDDATNTQVGGTAAGESNVISGNDTIGVFILGNTNIVEGNFIGTDVTGTLALSNQIGIHISGSQNEIGDIVAGARNIISGNTDQGIRIIGSNNNIEGNFIGTDILGTSALGNGLDGILLQDGASGNFIGGVSFATGNLIAGNGTNGIRLVGATTSDNTIQANRIGRDLPNVPNGESGIVLDGATNNLIGDTTFAGEIFSSIGNLIIVNTEQGVYLKSNANNNFIGENNVSGNGLNGILIENSHDNTVFSNVIRSNVQNGILLDQGSSGTTIHHLNELSGNIKNAIMVDQSPNNVIGGPSDINDLGNIVTAENFLGNRVWISIENGIYITGANSSGNLVQGNLVYVNLQNGLLLDNSANNNTLWGNIIGTDENFTPGFGNLVDGVHLDNAHSNRIGGIGLGNTITSSGNDGVELAMGSSNNILEANIIGEHPNSDFTFANAAHGIFINESFSNRVGNLSQSGFNHIIGNGQAGIAVVGNNAVSNNLRGNMIFENGGLGIDLGNDGVTLNDGSADLDIGPNKLQNFPTLFSLKSGDLLQLIITQTGPFANTFFVDIYGNSVTDPTGYGEGQVFIGSTTLTTNSQATVFFNPGTLPPGISFLTATATDAFGNTSEFSLNVLPIDLVSQPVDSIVRVPTIHAPKPFMYERPDNLARGFFHPVGINQISSFGDNFGFEKLVEMGDTQSFQLFDGKPLLLSQSRNLGFDEAVHALNSTYSLLGYPSDSLDTQQAIDEMTRGGETPQSNLLQTLLNMFR